MRDSPETARISFSFNTITKTAVVRLVATSAFQILSAKVASSVVKPRRSSAHPGKVKFLQRMTLSFQSKVVRRHFFNRGLAGGLIASILLVALGCHLPLVTSQSITTRPTLIEQEIRPTAEPEITLISVKPSQAGVTGSIRNDAPGYTNSAAVSNDSKVSTIAQAIANSHSELDLFDAGHWQFDLLPGSEKNASYFSNLLENVPPSSLVERIWDDQKNFYSPESLTLLGGGLIVGGAMANSSIDDRLHRHFQSSVLAANSDDWFESLHASKELGNGIYTLPVFATAWAAGELFPESRFVETTGRWGERSIRGFVVGAPPLIILQQLTGGSRPTETDESSEWHPMRDNNGISGHAFMGSLPFITAAKMTDNRAYKVLFYAGSTLAPLSRVNDNAHYPSQVALGWWMAYLAASAIDATDNPNSRWRFYPYSTEGSSGMMAEFRY